MFLNVCKQTFLHMSRAHISKSKRCFIVISLLYYFYMKTKIWTDFQICISVPLNTAGEQATDVWFSCGNLHPHWLMIKKSDLKIVFIVCLFFFRNWRKDAQTWYLLRSSSLQNRLKFQNYKIHQIKIMTE